VDGVLDFLRSTGSALAMVALVYAGTIAAERLWPAERGQPWRRTGFNLVIGLLLFLISAVLVRLLQPLILPLITAPLGGLLRIQLPDGVWGSFLQVMAYFLVYDFFYYWWHRAQHELLWLWPQHELHHSDTALNVTTSLRHHWLEDPLRVFAMAAPSVSSFTSSRRRCRGWRRCSACGHSSSTRTCGCRWAGSRR